MIQYAFHDMLRPCPKRRLRLQLYDQIARVCLFFNTGRRADLDVAVAEVVVSDTAYYTRRCLDHPCRPRRDGGGGTHRDFLLLTIIFILMTQIYRGADFFTLKLKLNPIAFITSPAYNISRLRLEGLGRGPSKIIRQGAWADHETFYKRAFSLCIRRRLSLVQRQGN